MSDFVMENKNVLRAARERADMSMQEVEARLARLSADNRRLLPITSERLGRIERGEVSALPEEVYALSVAYHDPSLCYDFCACMCGLGDKIVPRMERKDDLCSITCALLGSVREFEQMEKKLTILTGDGQIDCLEQAEFARIMEALERISANVQTMKFWAQTHVKL